MTRFELQGSAREPLPGARPLRPAAGDERLEISLILRPNDQARWGDRLERLGRGERPVALTREQFAGAHGTAEADLRAVGAFAAAHGLAVVQQHAARRTIVLAGTVAQMSAAFGVELWQFEHPQGTYRGLRAAVQLPEELRDIVVAVLGLDNRPQARPHFRVRTGPKPRRSRAATPPANSFTAVQIASLYQFPAGSG